MGSCGISLPHFIESMFNQTAKSLRLSKRLTLRDFCKQVNLDPSNWSKVERGINLPPSDTVLLERLAVFFGLTGSRKLSFMDEASLQRREIPPDLSDNLLLQMALPAFFRVARSRVLTEEKLQDLVSDIRRLHSPDLGEP